MPQDSAAELARIKETARRLKEQFQSTGRLDLGPDLDAPPQTSRYAAERDAFRRPPTSAPANRNLPSRFPVLDSSDDEQEQINADRLTALRRQPELTSYEDDNRFNTQQARNTNFDDRSAARDKATDFFPKWARPALDFLPRQIDYLQTQTAPGIALNRFSKGMAGANGQAPMEYNLSTGNKTVDKVADIAGSIAGWSINPGNPKQTVNTLYQHVTPWVQKGLDKTVNTLGRKDPGLALDLTKTLNKAGNLTDSLAYRTVREGAEQGLTAGAWGAMRKTMDPEAGLGDITMEGLKEGAMGAALGMLTPGAADAFKAAGRGIQTGAGKLGQAKRDYTQWKLEQDPLYVDPTKPDYFRNQMDGIMSTDHVGPRKDSGMPQALDNFKKWEAEGGTFAQPEGAAPAPAPAAPPMAGAQVRPSLPHELSRATPNYRIGQTHEFAVEFESDVDKALYIVARVENRSRRDADYMDFLRGIFPDKSDVEIRGMGISMRQNIKGLAQGAAGRNENFIKVTDSDLWRINVPEAPPEAPVAPPAAQQGIVNAVEPPFEATHTMPQHAYGGGTPVKLTDNGGPTIRYESQDGKIKGSGPRDYVQRHFEPIQKDPPLTNEQAAAMEEIRRGQMEQTAGKGPSNDFDGPDFMDDPHVPRRAESGFYGTAEDAGVSPKTMGKAADRTHEVRTDKQLQMEVQARLEMGIDHAYDEIMGRGGATSKLSDTELVTAQQLIRLFSQNGSHRKAVNLVEKLSEAYTETGRKLRTAQLMKLLSPEGAVMHARGIVGKDAKRRGVLDPGLSEEQSARISKAASKTEVAGKLDEEMKAIYAAIDKAKAGKAMTSRELTSLKIAKESVRQQKAGWAPDMAPKETSKPREPREPRLRDAIVQDWERQAKESKEALKKGKNKLNSTPVDEWNHYAKIARAAVAKGAVRFGDFSQEMVGTFGDKLTDTQRRKLYVSGMNALARKEKRHMPDYEKALNAAIKNQGLSEADEYALKVFAKELSHESRDLRRVATGELQREFNLLSRTTMMEKYAAWENIAMLLQASTQVVNVLSNAAMLAVEAAARRSLGAVIDFTRTGVFKGKREIAFRSNTSDSIKNYWSNWMKGWDAGWHGISPDGFDTAYELNKGLAFENSSKLVKNTVGYLEKTLYATMKSFDYGNAMHAVNKHMGETATIIGREKGLRGRELKDFVDDYINQYYDELMDTHAKYGEFATFQDSNLLSDAAVKGREAMNLGQKFGAGDIFLKFAKVPANLLMRTIDYSPMGSLKLLYKLYATARKKPGYTATVTTEKGEKVIRSHREWEMQLSRTLIGTGFSAVGYKLAELGIMTGASSPDEKLRDAKAASGMNPYGFNVSAFTRWMESGFKKQAAKPKQGDSVVTYNWVQPFAASVAMGATFAETLKDGTGSPISAAFNGADQAVTSVVDQSFIRGLYKAFKEPSGDAGVLSSTIETSAGLPTRAVPSALKGVRRATDNDRREINYNQFLPSMGQQLQNSVPSGLVKGIGSQELPSQTDFLGKEKLYYDNTNPVANALQAFAMPGQLTRYKNDGVRQKTGALYEESKDTKTLPGKPDKKVSLGKNADGTDRSVDLNAKQYKRYKDLIAEETRQIMDKTPLNKLSPQDRIRAAAAMLEGGRQAARGKLIEEYKLYAK